MAEDNRDETGRWAAGQSGNPKGRPPVDLHVRDLARQHTAEAIDVLVAVAQDPKQRGRDRTAAAVALLDRGWGRPTERLEETVAVERADDTEDKLRAIYELAGLVWDERHEKVRPKEASDGTG